MQTKTYHLICYFLFALALVLIGTIGSAGILVAACAAEDTMGSAVNLLCELHLIVPLVLRYGYQILLPIPLMMLTVGIGEVISCGVLGMVLYFALNKYRFTIFKTAQG